MARGMMRAFSFGVIATLGLVLTGCGDSSKKGEPKVAPDAKKIQEKSAGGPGAPKGAAQ
jgi:hypothetical protein